MQTLNSVILVGLISIAINANKLSILEKLGASQDLSQDVLLIGNGRAGLQNLNPNLNSIAYLNSDSTCNYTCMAQRLKIQTDVPLSIVITADEPFTILREFGKPVYPHLWQFFILSTEEFEYSVFNGSTLSEYLNFFSDVYLISSLNGTIMEEENGFGEGVEITEFYSFKNTTFIEHLKWEFGKSFFVEILRKATRRRNFRKLPVVGTLVFSYGRDSAFLAEVNNSTGEVKLVSGFRIEEFYNMRDSLNFTAVGVIADGFAYLGPDGKLMGIGKHVSDGIADITIPASELVPFRLDELTFLHPSSLNELFAYFKQLPVTSLRDVYFTAFQTKAWMVHIAIFGIFTLIVTLLIYIWTLFRGYHYKDHGVLYSTIEYVLLTVGVLCQQGSFKLSKRGPPNVLKVVIFIGILASFVLYTAYCGSIVSTLSMRFLPISSFRHIFSYKFKVYAVADVLAAKPLLKFLQSRHKYLNEPEYHGGESPFINDSEILSKVLTSKTAVLINSRTTHAYWNKVNISDRYLCEHVSRVPIHGQPTKSGAAVKKGSPLKEVFNHHILQMYERGINHRIQTRYKKATSFNCVNIGAESGKIHLGLNDMLTAIIILASGLVLSLFVLCLEKLLRGVQRNGSI